MIRKSKVPSWHQVSSNLQGPNKMATSCSKSQAIPSSGWMEGAGAGWERSLFTGDQLRRNQPCSILLLSPAWVISFSTEHLCHPEPDGKFSKSASCSTRDLGLGNGMHFFLHWAFIIFFFLLDDIPGINSSWRNLGRWQANMKKIWGRG